MQLCIYWTEANNRLMGPIAPISLYNYTWWQAFCFDGSDGLLWHITSCITTNLVCFIGSCVHKLHLRLCAIDWLVHNGICCCIYTELNTISVSNSNSMMNNGHWQSMGSHFSPTNLNSAFTTTMVRLESGDTWRDTIELLPYVLPSIVVCMVLDSTSTHP